MGLMPVGAMRRRRAALAVEAQRLCAAVEALSAARTTADTGIDLPGLLRAVWQAYGSSAWVVGDLRARGLIGKRDTAALGHALARAVADDVPVAGLVVERIGESRAGKVWMLRPVR